jgi:hypothetical protein
MISDAVSITGTVALRLTGPDGREKVTHVLNLSTTVGKQVTAERLLAAPSRAAVSHIAVGTGATLQTAADVALVGELVRVALSSAARVGAVNTYIATLPPGIGTGALAEAGLFNAPGAGDMLARTTFPVVNKGVDDTLQIIWNLTVG